MNLRLSAQETLEDRLSFWARSPSQSETEKCENAVRAVRSAINSCAKLKSRNVRVIPQGSYRNRTNVRGESDVDVGVVCYDSFFPTYPAGTNAATFNNSDASYSYPEFKNDVESALVDHFGKPAVHRGNKAFDIHENTYRVDADVAAFFEHRRYRPDGSFLSGAELRPDNEKSCRIINWPEQHYANGNEKNDATRRSYRGVARILKNIRTQLGEQNLISPECVTGFLCECLAWNTPNELMTHPTYTQDLRATLLHLFEATKDDAACKEWGEVSELKYLFRTSQRWSRSQANEFVVRAWQYIGFE